MDNNRALVLFSGGQDSATCLAWALEKFEHVETVGFDYRQRHNVELKVRKEFTTELRKAFPNWSTILGEDHVLDVGSIAELGETAMTSDIEIKTLENGLPNTFVPGRNLLFLTYAAALAYRRNIKHIVMGVCETDYSGYPDCRDDTIKALQVAINLGMETRIAIHTPLMWRDKANTWELAYTLGKSELVDLILQLTHSCYQGNHTDKHDWGYGCNACPACELRNNGWERWGKRKSYNQEIRTLIHSIKV
jgi:7-cyano-7-deazaguanine synthase